MTPGQIVAIVVAALLIPVAGLLACVDSALARVSKARAEEFGVPGFGTTEELLADDGIDIVVIATPNHLHLPAALAAIEAGVHIVSDKPVTATLAEARVLEAALAGARSAYAVTYTYTGFPMVREARARIAAGQIGRNCKVIATYLQGWLAGPAATRPR